MDSALDQDDRRLLAAREAFPAWDIIRVFGGYLATLKDTPIIQGIDVDSVVAKIRRWTESEQLASDARTLRGAARIMARCRGGLGTTLAVLEETAAALERGERQS